MVMSKAQAAHVARFERAAKKCKGSRDYRACMKRELRKK